MKNFFLSIGLGIVFFVTWYTMTCSGFEIKCSAFSILLTTPLEWWVGILVQENIFDFFGVKGAFDGIGVLVFNALCFAPFLLMFSILGILLRKMVVCVFRKNER
jgi:hypothetical protein